MAKRSPGLESVGSLIGKSMGSLGDKVDRLYRTQYALHHLPELIGSAFADHIRPLGVRHKKLFIHVPEDAWRSEIWMFREEIIRRINQCAGEEIVQEIISTRQWNERSAGMSNREGNDTSSASRSMMSDEIPLPRLLEKGTAATAEGGEGAGPSRRTELGRVNLTDEEVGKLRESSAKVQDEELRKRLFSLSLKRKKLERLRAEKKWHPCPLCGTLCPPEEEYCQFCSSKERSRVRGEIRSILMDLPWLRYQEIKKSVPCTPDLVDSVRWDLMRYFASKVRMEDSDSLDAQFLVMLYLHLPPDYLTEELVKRTLYRLRNDLARSGPFQSYKRYDVIPLGKKARRRGRNFRVPSSGK